MYLVEFAVMIIKCHIKECNKEKNLGTFTLIS